MIRLRLNADDIARIRFAFVPTWEIVMSVRALLTPGGDRFHGPRRRAVAADLRASDVDLGLLA